MNFLPDKNYHRYRRTIAALAVLCAASLSAQYPIRTQSQPTTRAIAVLEFLGLENKPTASRLIPISLFINGHLQDAALYLARLEPMALAAGTRYEIQHLGTPTGYFDLTNAAKIPDPNNTLWIGLGHWHALDPARPHKKIPPSIITLDDGQPHLLRRPGSELTVPDITAKNATGPVLTRKDNSKPTAAPNPEPDPELHGNPIQMQQRVAVSDAAPRDPHPFTYTWPDPETPAALQTKLEAAAQKAIADYIAAQPQPPVPINPPTLAEEKFTAWQLAKNAPATLVFTAQTTGTQLRYVTLIAQLDIYGQPIILLKNVTDAAHLDQTPRMNLIDAVDAEGANHGDLLFELRAENERQFALYRIDAGTATQIFQTNPMP